jgi:hypothetical protein
MSGTISLFILSPYSLFMIFNGFLGIFKAVRRFDSWESEKASTFIFSLFDSKMTIKSEGLV